MAEDERQRIVKRANEGCKVKRGALRPETQAHGPRAGRGPQAPRRRRELPVDRPGSGRASRDDFEAGGVNPPPCRHRDRDDQAFPVDNRPDIAPATKMAHDRASLRDEDPMKIAMVGGGIGGLATALAMTKAGLAVTVHERSEQLVDQGAGITLGPNATRVLYHLDIGPALEVTSVVPPKMEYRHYSTGSVIKRVITGDFRAAYGSDRKSTRLNSSHLGISY